jgi:hypothetical protein
MSYHQTYSTTFAQASRHVTFWVIVGLRALFLAIATITVGYTVNFGTPLAALVLAGAAGTVAGSYLAFSALSTRGFLTVSALSYGGYLIVSAVLQRIFAVFSDGFFGGYGVMLHLNLMLLSLYTALAGSWFFWRVRHWITAEVLCFSAIALALLSAHRNYRLDSPQIINTLAWNINLEPLTVLVSSGVALSVGLLGYLFCATLPGRPSPRGSVAGERNPAPPQWVAWGCAAVAVLAAFYLIAREVYQTHRIAAGSRLMNGVGEATSQEGLSPLGFHSALGATNQPSALARLDGDYRENPFTPMLYLREQALSEFNGHELVLADSSYDKDVSGNLPSESFSIEPDTTLAPRVPVQQSMYLLTEHKLAFSLDFPLRVTPLANPNRSRFKAAFQAYSMAPAFPLAELQGAQVGDPRWSEATQQHYLKKHSDPRYQELADSITKGITDPIAKASAFAQHLNKTAIYTLTPNHDVSQDADQVAPFLFGDMRGYCVHFAHAMVYMLRASGVPARIGTGYLTDLSQAKDGHILLRMSDRHAWAEVFVRGKGWVPFDVQPEQVESHGDSAVDQSLLEELMQSLEPPEEALPKDIAKNEPGMQDDAHPLGWLIPSQSALLTMFILLTLLPLTIKGYLRCSWMLPASVETQARRLHRAIASRLHDLGWQRAAGETRQEYEARVSSALGPQAVSTTRIINALRFGPPQSILITPDHLASHRAAALRSVRALPWQQRLKGWISPRSVAQFVLGGNF